MWAEQSGQISRSSLSSIYETPAHRSAPLIWVLEPLHSRSAPQQGRIQEEGGQGPRAPSPYQQQPPIKPLIFFISRMILNFQKW